MLITVFGVLLSFLSPLGEGAEQGAVRYVNYCLWRSAVLLASPRGEVASRSDDGEGYYDALMHSSIFY